MEINFRTKEESNRIQREEFLKLSPVERIYSFFDLMYKMKKFPVRNTEDKSDNFLIEFNDSFDSGKVKLN